MREEERKGSEMTEEGGEERDRTGTDSGMTEEEERAAER